MSRAATELQLATFLLGDEEYGVDVMKVREIAGMMEITKTANSPDYVEGVINLRGNIVPIISLRKRLGMTDTGDRTMSSLAIMDFAGELTGFVIDEVSDVMRVNRSDINPPAVAISQPWIEGIIHRDDKMVVLIDLESLS